MPDDIAVRQRDMPYLSRGIRRRLGIIADVARQPGDVVHVTGDIHFAVFGLRRRRAVLTVLDCGLALGTGLRASIFRRVWLQWPARRAARIVAISSFSADQLAHYGRVDRARIDVVPVVVDDSYAPVPPNNHATPVVLCFAKTPNKNLHRVLEALTGLDVRLHVVGPMSDVTEKALVASGLPATCDVDLSETEIRESYANCDLLLFPSTYEGFGMPIVEAQAVGRPVVTSDRAPMNEVAGGAACLVDPEDVASIRDGVQRVLNDASYRAELVRKGLENRERFRPEVAARAYAQIYREMAGAVGPKKLN